MQKLCSMVFVLTTIVLIASCAAPAPPVEMKDAKRSMIFGHVIAPSMVTEVELREYGTFYFPLFARPPRVVIFENGNFMAENLKPGKYMISAFNTEEGDFVLVKSRRTAYQRIINVAAGEAKYIGSWKITDIKTGRFNKGEFDIRRVRKPGERRVIKHLFQVAKGTAWEAMLEHRMQELRQ